MANTAEVDAPAVIPMMSGDANGLRASDWKIAPDSPKAAPTSTADERSRQPELTHDERSSPVGPKPQQGGHHVTDRDREVADRHRPAERAESGHRQRSHRPPRLGARPADASRADHGTISTTVARRPFDRGGRRRTHSSASFRRRASAMKNGAPISAVEDPDLDLARAGDHPSDDIGTEQQDRSQDRGVDQYPPVVGSGDGAGDVRDGQADEPDRAGRCGSGSDEQDDRQHGEDPAPGRPAAPTTAPRRRRGRTRSGPGQRPAPSARR